MSTKTVVSSTLLLELIPAPTLSTVVRLITIQVNIAISLNADTKNASHSKNNTKALTG